MPKTKLPADLAEALREGQANIAALRDIAALNVMSSFADASSLISAGAVLLAVATVKDDSDGDGFRFLLGLPRSVKVTSHLAYHFPDA